MQQQQEIYEDNPLGKPGVLTHRFRYLHFLQEFH